MEVRIGGNELVILLEDGREQPFRVTRMRCWRVQNQQDEQFSLSFHFLKGKNEFVWVKIQTADAILM